MYYFGVIIIIVSHYKINSFLACLLDAFLLLPLHSYYTNGFIPIYQIYLVFLLYFCFHGNKYDF